MAPSAKSWGPRRTGTNVLTVTLEQYTDLDTDVPGWKHAIPETVPAADAHVIHVKHPYAWLLSMERWWGVGDRVERTLRKAHAAWDARDAVMRAHATRLDAYAALVRGWRCALPSERTLVVRYEDVLRDVSREVERIAETAGATVEGTPALPGQRVDSRGSKTKTSFDPTYYTDERWVEELSRSELEELDGLVDECGYRSLFEGTLGYKLPLDPSG